MQILSQKVRSVRSLAHRFDHFLAVLEDGDADAHQIAVPFEINIVHDHDLLEYL